MKKLLQRFWIPVLLFLISASLMVVGLWKTDPEKKILDFPVQLQTESGAKLQIPAYTLEIQQPEYINLGSMAHLKLLLIPVDTSWTLVYPLFNEYTLALETRLDLVGGTFEPDGLITAPLSAQKTNAFIWNVHPDSKASLSGTLWVYLAVMPTASGPIEEMTLYALPVEIPVRSILGLSMDVAIVIASLGLLLSIVLLFIQINQKVSEEHNRKRIIGRK